MTVPLVVPALPRLPALDGGWLAVSGTAAGVAAADVKGNGARRDDVAVLVAPGSAAAVTTTSTAAAASCHWTRARTPGPIHAVVINSGNANAATGPQGEADNARMAQVAAEALGCAADAVLVCSTGVIGVPLPMGRLLPGVQAAAGALTAPPDALARAILTTDLVPKTAAVRSHGITVGGFAKGSGMIHPGMATMLAFLATDAAVDPHDLHELLVAACDRSFHAITVDGDQSTNDTVIVQATGRGRRVRRGTPAYDALGEAITAVATDLARAIARDGEGATTLVECVVLGGPDDAAARRAARAVVGSSLVKSAIHGRDPNWGRILGALGQAGLPGLVGIDVDLAGVPVMRGGRPLPFDESTASAALQSPDVQIACRVPGAGLGRAWGCDLSADYVRINADYRS